MNCPYPDLSASSDPLQTAGNLLCAALVVFRAVCCVCCVCENLNHFFPVGLGLFSGVEPGPGYSMLKVVSFACQLIGRSNLIS